MKLITSLQDVQRSIMTEVYLHASIINWAQDKLHFTYYCFQTLAGKVW
jgi:hypothetical protein